MDNHDIIRILVTNPCRLCTSMFDPIIGPMTEYRYIFMRVVGYISDQPISLIEDVVQMKLYENQ